MRCDTTRELFDDLEAGRLAPSLQTELCDHVSECPACSAALARHKVVVAALGSLPAPALPDDFDAALMRRVRKAARRQWAEALLAFIRAALPVTLRYALVGGAAAATTAFVLASRMPGVWTDLAGDQPGEDASMQAATPAAVPAAPEKLASRVCNPEPDFNGLRVQEGEDVAVTLSVQTPEAMAGAKVYVVLPKGLTFSPVEHPGLADPRVLTFVEDIDEGGSDFGFTVRGTKPGKWDVTALVEEGDSVLLAGTTIAVAPQEDEP